MSTTNHLGRKIKGFEFSDFEKGIPYGEKHRRYLGLIGLVISSNDGKAIIEFEDRVRLLYPLCLIEQHLVPESGGEKPKGPWQVIERSGQIADTGDYVGEAELTDGKIHLYCTTEFDCEADEETPLHTVANILNESKADLWVDFMRDDPDAMDLLQRSVNAEAYRVENERLRAALNRALDLLVDIDSTLFHHSHEVVGWHKNDAGEPMMNFVADFDMDAINEIKSALEHTTNKH